MQSTGSESKSSSKQKGFVTLINNTKRALSLKNQEIMSFSKKNSSKSKFSHASNGLLLQDSGDTEILDSKAMFEIEKLQAEILKRQHELQIKIKKEA